MIREGNGDNPYGLGDVGDLLNIANGRRLRSFFSLAVFSASGTGTGTVVHKQVGV